jgi:lysine-specific demethylase/histidyl-hydroxylase NO66
MKRQRRDEQSSEEDAPDADDDLPLIPLILLDDRAEPPSPLATVVQDAAARDEPERVLQHLLHPLSLERFGEEVWERRPVLIQRRGAGVASCLDGLLSKGDIDALLRERELRYGLHVDVTRYDEAAGRSTLNDGEERAAAADVWRHYAAGCSVRVLHPQRWVDPLHALLATLERHWRCAGGCNAYMTPASTQGFAPHYDDIDAFVLQLEGRKRWRLYGPRCEEDVLPRVSSENFNADEIGEPILDVVLEPGDVLYMPRGCIHQAASLPESHSLHVTLSTGHANAWVDLLELALPAALATAAQEIPELRASVPRRFLDCVGVMHAPDESGAGGTADLAAQREEFILHAQTLLRAVLEAVPLDAAADQLGARFMRTRLPPPQPAAAAAVTKLTPRTRVRLAFAGAARLVVEDDCACVYHPFANDRTYSMEGYEQAESAKLAFPLELAPAVEALLRAHPTPVELRTLPLASPADGLELAQRLLDARVLVVV